MDTTRRCPTARLPQDGSPASPFTACRWRLRAAGTWQRSPIPSSLRVPPRLSPSRRTSSRYGLSTLSLWVGRSSACSTCSAAPIACAAPWHRSTTWPCAWTSSAVCSSPAARWKHWSRPSSAQASTRRASLPATPTWQASRLHSTAYCARCKRPNCSKCTLSTMRATSCARPSR